MGAIFYFYQIKQLFILKNKIVNNNKDMIIDPKNPKHLIAKEGKVIARLKNLKETYNEVWLGYHVDENGVKKMDTKADFTEIRKQNVKR